MEQSTGRNPYSGELERAVYSLICSRDGIKARDIARLTGADKTEVNRCLYLSPFMRELCYRDDAYLWHGLIRQARPHTGLGDFSGWYGTIGEFLALGEEAWFLDLQDGCRRIGRNLNDTRGLFHSFRDCRLVMLQLFTDLKSFWDGSPERKASMDSWELVFELRINRARYIRIYADVLVITGTKVFSLEFKMKDKAEPDEVSQAAKYVSYLEVLFGPQYDVIPALVLTKASDLYSSLFLNRTDAKLPVCSGDMLFNLFDEYA